MTVADTIWLATKQLELENPDATGFSRDQIERRVRQIDPTLKSATVAMHLSAHCLAWKPARPSRLRTLSQNPDGTLRLFRQGDPFHPERHGGRVAPKVSAVSDQYRDLLGGFDDKTQTSPSTDSKKDPLLALAGSWPAGAPKLSNIIIALREETFPPDFDLSNDGYPLSAESDKVHVYVSLKNRFAQSADTSNEPRKRKPPQREIWDQVVKLQRLPFKTVKGEPFFYEVKGNGIVPHPGMGPATNRILPRTDLEKAWSRMPVSGPGALSDLQGPSYLFGILTDPRVRGA